MDSNNPTFWTDPEPYYATQYRILQSPGLAQYTVRQLDLSTAPEFTGEAPRQFGPLEAIRAVRSTVIGWARTVGTTLLGVIGRDAVERPTAQIDPEEDELLALSAAENAQVGNFVSRLSVSPVVNTRLVDVTFTSAYPVFAAEAGGTTSHVLSCWFTHGTPDGRFVLTTGTPQAIASSCTTPNASARVTDGSTNRSAA